MTADPASPQQPILTIAGVGKRYKSGLVALDGIDLVIAKGEIFALLGPNGAGKTTLISIVCGTVTRSAGTVTVDGHDNVRDFRAARAAIRLVALGVWVALFATVREGGVTVILTTHYIEEAEEMADRVGVIDHGRLLLVEDKAALMRKLGKRRAILCLREPLTAIPPELADWPLMLEEDGCKLVYTFDAEGEGIAALIRRLETLGIAFTDLETARTSLEDIFVDLVERPA